MRHILVIYIADPSQDYPSLSVIKNNLDQTYLHFADYNNTVKQLTSSHYSDEGDWTEKESVLDSFLKVTMPVL